MDQKKEKRLEFVDILSDGVEYRLEFYRLYEAAFPKEEKKPAEMLERMAGEGKLEMLAILEGETFAGLAVNMLSEKAALLDYFAVEQKKRSCGYGSRAIRALQERFDGKKYILEIERQDPDAENAGERLRRKKFYLGNGLKETGVLAHAYETDFELLTPDGCLTYEEYEEMLRDIMGKDLGVANPSPVNRKEMQ